MGQHCGAAGYAILAIPASYGRVLVQVTAAPLPVQLPANVLEKTVEGGPNSWAPVTHTGALHGVPSSWFQLVSDVAAIAIWEVN